MYPYMKVKELYQYGKPVYELKIINNHVYLHNGRYICNTKDNINQVMYNNGYAPLYNILGFEYQWLNDSYDKNNFYHHFSLKDNKFHNHHNTISYKLNDYIELYKILYNEHNQELNYYLKHILRNYEMFGKDWFYNNELNLYSWEKYDKIQTRYDYKTKKKNLKFERGVRLYNLSSTGKYKTMRYYRNDKKYKSLTKEFIHDVNQYLTNSQNDV